MTARMVEILSFKGCPNAATALERVRAALVASGLAAVVVKEVMIETVHEARTQRFVGSPTVRVDGEDVDPGASSRTDYGLQCRVYEAGGKVDRAPPLEWIRDALRGAKVQE